MRLRSTLFALALSLLSAAPAAAQNGWEYTGDEDHGLSVEVLSFSPSNVGNVSGLKLTFRVWSTWWEKTGESRREAYYFQKAALYCSTSADRCDTGTVTVNEVQPLDDEYYDGKDFEMWVGGLENLTAYNWHLLVHLTGREPPDPFFGGAVDVYLEDWSSSPTTTTGTGQTVAAKKQYTMVTPPSNQISDVGAYNGTYSKVISGDPTITMSYCVAVTIVEDIYSGEWYFTVGGTALSFQPNAVWGDSHYLPFESTYNISHWQFWNGSTATESPPVQVAMNDAGGYYYDYYP